MKSGREAPNNLLFMDPPKIEKVLHQFGTAKSAIIMGHYRTILVKIQDYQDPFRKYRTKDKSYNLAKIKGTPAHRKYKTKRRTVLITRFALVVYFQSKTFHAN